MSWQVIQLGDGHGDSEESAWGCCAHQNGGEHRGVFMGWRQLPAAPNSGQTGQWRSLLHRCPAWLEGERGAIFLGSLRCVVVSRCLAAPSLAGLSRAFVLQVELNVKTFGDLNYYL